MGPSAEEVRETLRGLRNTTRYFKRTTSGLTEAQLRAQPEPDSWSAYEVLAHLRGCADVQGAWIERMLAEVSPTIRYVSPRTGMRNTDYAVQGCDAFFQAFARERRALVKSLSSLNLADWSRDASFTGTTRGTTRTVFALACGLVAHEQAHFPQIAAAARGAS